MGPSRSCSRRSATLRDGHHYSTNGNGKAAAKCSVPTSSHQAGQLAFRQGSQSMQHHRVLAQRNQPARQRPSPSAARAAAREERQGTAQSDAQPRLSQNKGPFTWPKMLVCRTAGFVCIAWTGSNKHTFPRLSSTEFIKPNRTKKYPATFAAAATATADDAYLSRDAIAVQSSHGFSSVHRAWHPMLSPVGHLCDTSGIRIPQF